LPELYSITFHKTEFFIVTAARASNLTIQKVHATKNIVKLRAGKEKNPSNIYRLLAHRFFLSGEYPGTEHPQFPVN
jgi:hypothetical protein